MNRTITTTKTIELKERMDNKDQSNIASQQDTTGLLHLSGLPVGQELIPECEVILVGEEGSLKERWNDCEKNPGHPNFIPVKKFGFDHLPEELQTEQIMRSIRRRCNLTVRVVVRYTSTNRPDTFYDNKAPYPYSRFKGSKKRKRYGTGLVIFCNFRVKKFGKCPCPSCKKSTHPEMEYWELIVKTATHVIYDDSEAELSVFDCFYDSEDGVGVKKLYGIHTLKEGLVPGSHYKSDICNVLCVTHDKDTVQMLSIYFQCTLDVFFENMYYCPPGDVIVSHPHGCSKHITVGNSVSITFLPDSLVQTDKQRFSRATICRLPMNSDLQNKNSQNSAHDKEQLETYRNLIRSSIKPQQNGLHETMFFEWVLPYMSLYTTLEQENVYNIITGIACGLHRSGIRCDLISSTLNVVTTLDVLFSVLIVDRLDNMKISDTRTPELIDVGLLLWKCCCILVKDLFKNFKMGSDIHDVNIIIVKFFLLNIYAWKPELLQMFNLHQYVAEQSKKHLFSDRKDAFKTVHRILSAGDSIKDDGDKKYKDVLDLEGSIKDTVKNDEDDNEDDFVREDDIDDESEKARFLNNTLPLLCWNVKEAFQDIYRYRQFQDKKKTLVDPESDEFLQPGTELLLPVNMTFTLPPQAKFIKKCHNKNLGYHTFPPGTKYHLITTNHSFEFPLLEEAEFFSVDPSTTCCKSFMTYNTGTCPGSSGAYLESALCADGLRIIQVHSGAAETSNVSGIGLIHGNDIGTKDFGEHLETVMKDA